VMGAHDVRARKEKGSIHMAIPPAKLKPTQAREVKRPIGNRPMEPVHDERQDDKPKRKHSRVESKPVCEKHCDSTIVNLPISTPAWTPPVPYSAPVAFSAPATPFYNTTPPAHSQYPPVFPYSSYYFSPTPSFSISASPYGYYPSPSVPSHHGHPLQMFIHPYNMSSTSQLDKSSPTPGSSL